MAVIDQLHTDEYSLYEGDCVDVMHDMPDNSIDLSVYSPPFGGLYNYSSDPKDMSNCSDYNQFFEHYAFVVEGIARVTKLGRCTAVHCMDVPNGNAHFESYTDFPGDIIRLHEAQGFKFIARHAIWKEPLGVRRRTMQKNLAHQTAVEDSIDCGVASADYLLIFKNKGENQVPVSHPNGFRYYAGDDSWMSKEQRAHRDWAGDQKRNIYSHGIWRRYASSMWDDIRQDRVLPFQESKDEDDEKHVHPLQLDVIDRVVQMRSNPGEVVFSPFAGVGSEPYSAITHERKAIGVELKHSYYKQMVQNLADASVIESDQPQQELFA